MAGAAISAGASILGSIAGGKGASKAAKIQAQAYQQGLAQQQAQFAQTRQDMMPYLNAGTQALGAQSTLLGLNGNDQQQAAIDALKASPAFTSLFNTGQDAILANAAATGGLRGGNTQNSLARFGSDTLAQVIQNQLAGLGGLSGMGQGAASNLGSLGQSNANAQSQLYGQIGGARATQAAAPYAAFQSALSGLNSIYGQGGSAKW